MTASTLQPDGTLAEDHLGIFETDPRISYPNYKSLDEFIDVEQLTGLDDFITEKIEQRIAAAQDVPFYTGPYKLEDESQSMPGTRMIYLSEAPGSQRYLDLDAPNLWQPTKNAEAFKPLMDFIATLPFQSTGRMLIIYDTEARPVSAHRDHLETDINHEFIWFRTNKKKRFYMLNHATGQKQYVDSYSAWFDSVNQFHGGDGCDGLSFSIRVDGVFTEELRARMPRPACNAASTPALWACLSSASSSSSSGPEKNAQAAGAL